jgi:hypothetical protein
MSFTREEAETIFRELGGIDSETFSALSERDILQGSETFKLKVWDELTDMVESFETNPLDFLQADEVRLSVDLSALKDEVLDAATL